MRLNLYRAWDKVLERWLTEGEVNAYTLEALNIPGSIIFSQFTGFSDKKKKMIFEDDIVDDGEKCWRIIFSEGTFVGHGPGRWKPLRSFITHGSATCEIVGNKMENPNLVVLR